MQRPTYRSTLPCVMTLGAAFLLSCASSPKPMPETTASTAQAPIPPPHASKLVSGSVAEFQKAGAEDLARVRTLRDTLATLDGKKQRAEVLNAFNELQSRLMNAGARASVARNSHPDAAFRDAADASEQEVEKLSTEIGLDRRLYDVLSAVDTDGLDGGTKLWLERTLRDMRRAGVDRDDATRARITALNEELTRIGQEFGKNIREDVRFVELPPSALAGLPEDYKKAHPPGPNGKVRITTDYPDYVPFMTYAKDGKAREQLWRVYRQRAHPKNLEVLNRLLSKRHELATLLGYPNWAEYVTETKMIGNARRATEFIEEVNRAAESAAKREYAELLALKQRDDKKATRLEPWDQDYYEDRYKAEKFGFDSQSMRPYLEYERVLGGVLDVTSHIFGIRYTEVKDAAVWHPDVRVYDVHDASGLRGRVYLDMHPRENKYKHAAQFELVSGQKGKVHPEGVLMCNFPQPGGSAPALMQPREVETFFHEFGHLLHHILGGDQAWVAQSGVKTEWDFVETPSMLLQEWAQNAEALARFAKHHETGEPLPADMVKRMVAASEFGKGLYTRRQMYLSAVSLNYYNREPGFDTTQLARELQPRFEPFRKEFADDTYFQLAFGHLDGYSAIYYTYIWSSVIARDLMTVFDKEGFLNPAPAQRYRKAILEAGGSKKADELVKDFLGREFSFKAYEQWLNTPPEVPTSSAAR